jgi:lysophospholipase L1-like esterase
MRAFVGILVLLLFSAPAPGGAPQKTQGDGKSPNVHPRGALNNSRLQFEGQKVGHVAFLGGSITEMNGYRPLVCDFLRRRFPQTLFTFTNAGIASTCSTTGAFRLASDVLAQGSVDLLFIEFAVNDDQDAHHTRRECIRGMEGIVRHVLAHNPNADIVGTYWLAMEPPHNPVPEGSGITIERVGGVSP